MANNELFFEGVLYFQYAKDLEVFFSVLLFSAPHIFHHLAVLP